MSDTPTRTVRGALIDTKALSAKQVQAVEAALNLDPAAPADRVIVLRAGECVIHERYLTSGRMKVVVRHVPAEPATETT